MRQVARVLDHSVTSEQWFSSSSAMVQHFLIIQKNLAGFLTLPLHQMHTAHLIPAARFDGARLRLETSNFFGGEPRKRHG
ncbi:hypothetical protein [Bradyrhizobium sp. NBAIM01]|uniref:hypothetical protein n=1 Tax=Bradyrhizobium sp. NBAIM01 TaxID=2793818 RepID=UPI001CD4C365|nr:hypothetical protein [Bradyrhizobium sp. NBAIM01]MCA1510305.1 hypothetical protein [Bradyrhizobium sp. NBAIM01]